MGPPAFLASLALAAVQARAAQPRELCPNVVFVDGDQPDLSEAEKRLVCGDPDREGWRQIPLSQAQYALKAFLQQRAYHQPGFETTDGVLRVSLGPRTKITGIYAEGLPPEIRISRRRGVIGSWLTPGELDRLQAWIRNELQRRGHGCPTVTSSADGAAGVVRVYVDPGPKHYVRHVTEAATGQLDPGVFRRFEAFAYEEPLDVMLLNLSASRVVEEDLFLSAYYDLSCSSHALSITQHVVTAPPRLITAGVGFDSEDLAKVRVRWRNSRIGWRASSFEAQLSASQRLQRGQAELRYYTRPSARWYLMPRAEGRRENELRYEALFGEASLQPAIDLDNQGFRLSLRAGPALEYVRTLRGQGPPDEFLPGLRVRASAMSHPYEYFARDPRTGWYATLETTSRHKDFYSPFTAHRLAVTGQRLWNIGLYDPPLLVFGWRTLVGTTLTDEASGLPGALPSALRFFLGGDADIRGFDRKELPIGGEGYLTAFYHGLELRLADVLPKSIQPLVFLDAAMAGRKSKELEREVYWSPGFGVRWGSPVGALRATLSRSFTARRDPTVIEHKPHLQFFFSWGQEF